MDTDYKIKRLRRQIDSLQKRNESLRTENTELKEKNSILEEKASEAEEIIEEYQALIDEMRDIRIAYRTSIHDLIELKQEYTKKFQEHVKRIKRQT